MIRLSTGTGGARPAVFAAWLLAAALPVHANLGFESGLTGWTIAPSPPADAVALITGCEGFGTPTCATTAPVYTTYKIRVEPISGNRMVRLGNPGQGNQSQPRGTNAIVSDPITVGSDPLVIGVRLFSYESRGTGRFVIEVLNEQLQPLAGAGIFEAATGNTVFRLGPSNNPAGSCTATGPTCSIAVKVPQSPKAPYDSGVDRAYIRGVANKTIRLRYSNIADSNNSKPTWVYVDADSLPVTASLFFSPGKSDVGGIAAEGDTLFFDCASAGLSTNPNGGTASCAWKAWGGGLDSNDPLTVDGPFAMFWFPDDNDPSPATVELTVSDPADAGNKKTIRTGANGVAAINLQNRAPAVSAIDVEVLEGRSGQAVCRFVDPGIGQIIGGQITDPEIAPSGVSIAGASDASVAIESEPPFTAGTATASVSTAGPATCSVADRNGESGTATFQVDVLSTTQIQARETSAWEPNDTTATATPFTPGKARLAYLATPNDIDVYEVVLDLASRTPPPAGAEVLITVAPPAADYDLIVLAETYSTTNPAFSGPLVTAPLYSGTTLKTRTAPLYSGSSSLGRIQPSPLYSGTTLKPRTAPLYSGSSLIGRFTTAPLYSGNTVTRSVQISPLYSGFAGRIQPGTLPLSEFLDAGQDSLSTTDINWTELGSQSLLSLQAENVEVVAVSAALGDGREQALVRVAPGTKKLFFAVVSTAGAQSSDPYAATVEVSIPQSQKTLLAGTGFCDADTTFDATHTGTSLAPPTAGGTLILTQRERFLVANGISLDDPDGVWGAIVAGLPADAKLVSVPGSWYAAADADPCDIGRWRSLADRIKEEIVGDPSRFAAIGIIGGADVVPPFALPDWATVGNERHYDDILARAGSFVSVATLEGNALVYGCYGARAPLSYLGGELCIEDVPVFVLAETPAQVLQKLAPKGGASSGRRVAFGYPPFDDGLGEAASAAGVNDVFNVTDVSETSQWWAASTMRENYLTCPADQSRLDLAIVNAHMSPNAALTAFGDLEPDFDDFVSAGEAASCLADTVTLSMGCHSGLNTPATMALNIPIFPYDPKADWVEQLGTWVGPTGFGLGSNGGVQLTEKLIALIARNVSEGQTLGTALVAAKREYLLGLQQVDPHDAKSLTNLTLFGLPTQTLGGSAASRMLAATATTCADDTLDLTILRNGDASDAIFQSELGYCLVSDARGAWYTLEGEAQSTYPRPLLPVFASDVSTASQSLVDLPHSLVQVDRSETYTSPCPAGAVCRKGIAGAFVDEPDSAVDAPHFDPVFPLPQTNWSNPREGAEDFEPYACIEVLSPTQLGGINALQTAEGTLWAAVVTGAQFRCDTTETDSAGIPRAKGTLRRWTSLSLDAVTPTDAAKAGDFVKPKVEQLDVTAFPATGEVHATLRGTDVDTGGSGIKEIILLVFNEPVPPAAGFVESYSVRGTLEGVAVPFTLPGAHGKRLAAWVIDGAGNASYKSLKGQLFEAIQVEILTTVLPDPTATQIRVLVGGFECLLAPTLTIDYSDGRPSQFYDLTQYLAEHPDAIEWVTTDEDCDSAIITIPQDFIGFANADITITTTVRAGGAIGTDSVTFAACSDPAGDTNFAAADIVSCRFASGGTKPTLVSIDATMLGNIDSKVQYRLLLPQFGAKLKLFDCGKSNCKATAPSGVTMSGNGAVSGKTVKFRFDAAPLGWSGTTPLRFQLKTQSGVPGSPGEGFPDETRVFTGSP